MTFLIVLLTAGAIGILALAALILLPFLGGFLLVRVMEILTPLCLVLWFLLHGRKNAPGWEKFRGVRFAHRGLHGPGVPENSLAAFRRAAAAGYGAELDVRLTKDGRLAVIHDSDLTRMCGRSGFVEELTAAELSAYRLAGSGEGVPFLEQVLPLFEGKKSLIVELKTARGNHAALAAAAVECLDRFQTDCCVESFDPRCLVWLRRHRPEILRGQLTRNFLKEGTGRSLWQCLALTTLLCNWKTRPDFVACRFEDRRGCAPALWRWWGGKLAYWTIRSPRDLRETERAGALPIFEGFVPEEESR
ncbi:glycerophosphodiester phosphodiesterase family protein [Dysosmobacter sp.]|uniref:glycerophosphodiester phosphodiesterase family protein n=1 Tax=Dysosmobacter sp. TaxID=2591382 RepID=UPI002A8AF8AD|nr:glycerophosphodiester phosphodiesterase family protein [Dysosmobacter sp.]MDY3985512.1 glycerophosphodiester phosphodiesterase family protein [Dysosmobacter sp.]